MFKGHPNKEFTTVEEFFNDIKKNWNTDISKKLQKH